MCKLLYRGIIISLSQNLVDPTAVSCTAILSFDIFEELCQH